MDAISIGLWALGGLGLLLLGGRAVRMAVGALVGPLIGGEALARQPDTIHLVAIDGESWRDAASADAATRLLVERGFALAGDFAVEEMPGVHVRLLAHEAEGWYAALCEHPLAGSWFDLVRRTESGESVTWTSAPPTGLDDRPGHPTHRVPGAHPGELFERARRDRPVGPARPATPRAAKQDFEAAYAESIEWRKARGITRREVARVASHPRRAA